VHIPRNSPPILRDAYLASSSLRNYDAKPVRNFDHQAFQTRILGLVGQKANRRSRVSVTSAGLLIRLQQCIRTLRRALLIVVSDVWEEEDHFWYDVVPLTSDIGHRTSDIEDATSLDLLLVRANTTLEVPGRMLLRYQAVADVHGLGSRVGTLTATGRAIVKDALAGCAPGQRFGTPVEGESDPRVRISDELDLTIRLINQHYAQVMETDNISKRPGRVLSFPMHTISINSAVGKTNSNLAVASHTEQEMNHWIVKIPERGSIRGRIEYEYSTDELFFAVEEVGEQLGLQTTAWIVVWADRHDTPAESQHFHPTIDQRIVIARDFAFPQEITRLEMRLLIDEA
jgi:hypothetical protein